jgi:thiol-disulfide isomerase/thioredoxin
MIERLALTLILFIVGIVAYRLYCRRQMRCAEALSQVDPLLIDRVPGIPTIVYFTTPTCAPCRLTQTPVLDRLLADVGVDGLRLIRVDATVDPAAAERWGVFSVPTLFVLDQAGQPRKVFNGVVGFEQLKQELQVS